MSRPRIAEFRLGVYIFKNAEVVDVAAPYAGGIASAMELGFHLLRRAGYDEGFVSEVARVMEYREAYNLYRGDVELAPEAARFGV